MNNFRYILIFCLFLYGCYGLDDEDLKDLSAISVDAVSDVINAKSGIPLNYTGIKISSDNDLPVTIEWAYGTSNPTATSYPIKDKLIKISDKLEIDYTFTKVGTYSLRLKVDNGESIVYKFFDLNVNSGLDEGILVLNNDENFNGKLTFIKTLNEDEDEATEQTFFEDIVSLINPGITFTHSRDLYIADKNSDGKYPALILSTTDETGTILKFDPRTLELQKNLKVEEVYPGVKCLDFAGFVTSGGRYTLVNGTDGAIYRYDLLMDDIAVRTDCRNLGVKKSYHARYGSSDFNHFFYNDNTIYSPKYAAVDSTWATSDLKEYQIINMALKRSGTRELLIVTRRLSDKNIVVHKMSTSFGSYVKRNDYEESAPIALDNNSIMITTLASTFVYYNYNNQIYRWDYSSRLPDEQSSPSIVLPENETITTLGFSRDEKQLYVGTYNEKREGKKGSLFIYEFASQSLVKSYQGQFDRPVKVIYKYRI